MKLTDRNIESIKPTNKDQWVTDSKIIGFCVRVNREGQASFHLWYRRNGKRLRHKIGDSMPANDARKLAIKMQGEIAQKIYPASKQDRTYTIAVMLQRYLEGHLGEGHQAERFIMPLMEALRFKQPKDFLVPDAITFFEALEATPATKTTMIKYLGASWNYALVRGHVLMPNPCALIKKVIKHKQQKRAKAIEPDRYEKLFATIRAMRTEDGWNKFALLAEEFLLYVPLRKTEALCAKECDIDGNVLHIPHHKNTKKHDKPLTVVLCAEALDIIQRAIALKQKLRMNSPYIFASGNDRISVSTLYNVWNELRRRTGVNLIQHNTRSGVINVLIDRGYTAEQISQYTGQSPMTIQTYYLDVLKNKASEIASEGGSIIGSYAKPKLKVVS